MASRSTLREAAEELERGLNGCLLGLIVELFCRAGGSPLDELIHRVLNSGVGPPDRRPEEMADGVHALDEW